MTNFRFAPLLLAAGLALGLAACSSSPKDDPDLTGANLPPADKLYADGVAQVQKGEYDPAIKKFDAVEENYPYSTWATHAQLMHGYAQYKQQNYDDAISALDRFIALHPENQDIAYAYYLKSLCYYEQIDDVQRDQTSTYEAIQTLNDVINRFPDSAYARDARLKIDLCNDQLAGHEMVIGRYYEKQHLYAAAINRYQAVVNNYQTTNHTAEALERLVEIYLKLGLTDEARRTAAVLAYNYPGSSWYQTAYSKLAAADVISRRTGNALVAGSDRDTTSDTGSLPPSAPATPPPKSSGGFFGWLF